MRLWPRKAATVGFLALFFVPQAISAQDAQPGLEIELLQLTPKAAAGAAPSCDMLWRVLNRSETRLKRVAYSVGIFTSEEVLFKSVPFNEIPAGRSKLVQFTMPGGCESYQSILFSDVVLCEGGDGQPAEGLCDIERLALSSPRTSVSFLE